MLLRDSNAQFVHKFNGPLKGHSESRQWRMIDRGAEGGSCPRAQQARGHKIGGAKVGFMQFVE